MILYEIYCIWLREMKKFWSDKGMIATSILVPIMGIVTFGLGFGSYVQIPGLKVRYLEYAGTGTIALLSMGAATFIGFSLIRDKKGFVKELLVVPISRYAIMLGKIISEITMQICSLAVAIVVVLLTAHTVVGPKDIFGALGVMSLLVCGYSGVGIILASMFREPKSYGQIMTLLYVPLMFLSGAFFPIDQLPRSLYVVARLNPLTYGVDAIRAMLLQVSQYTFIWSITYLVAFAATSLFISTWFFDRKVRQ